MNILNKLTVCRLKMNKKRTIVTIIGIVLSTALLCAVAGMVTSFQKTLKEHTKNTVGNFHVALYTLSKDSLKYIEKNEQIAHYFYFRDVGYSILEGSENVDKPYLWLKEYDDVALKNYGIQLTSGRMPKNSKEVVLSEAVYSNGGVKYALGDTISLQLGNRVLESGEKLENDLHTPLQTCENIQKEEACSREHLDIFETREVTVVGFMKRPSYQVEDRISPGYTIISKLDQSSFQNTNAAVLLKQPKNHRQFLKHFKQAIESDELEYFVNDELLRYEGVLNDGTMQVLVNVSVIVFIIIIVSSVFVIKNSFTISVTERIREYGMLSSVGATKKQIRKSVLFEGFLLGIIGIPFGILAGILAIFVLLLLLNVILGEFISDINFVYHVPLLAIVFSIFLSGITIYLSSVFPARRAAKIAPIEAIRGNQEIFCKRKIVKTPRFFKKVFSIGGDIAYKNLKRSRKKYRTTVVSLVVSIVLFLSLTALIEYGFRYTNIYYQKVDYDAQLWINRSYSNDEYEILQKISKNNRIDQFSLTRSFDLNISTEKYANPVLLNHYFKDHDAFVSITSLGNEEYDRFLRHIGLNPALYQDKAILIDQVYYYMDNKYHDTRYFNVEEGDIISGEAYFDENTYHFEIGKITRERPMGILQNGMAAYLIISDDMMDKITTTYNTMLYVDSNDIDGFVKEVEEMKLENRKLSDLAVYNLHETVRENNAMILVISIFLYGFIAVITLIGVTNIFNTITTNMTLRKREFAMLRSIGMTRREFQKMIRLESIFYGLKSLLFGIPIGVLLGYFIYRGIQKNLETPFVIPYFEIGLCIVAVALIVGVTMHYSLKRLQKENIIDVIRTNNV